MSRLALPAIGLIALVHSLLFIAYQYPDRDVAWTDQGGYEQLGAALATTGRFTRYPGEEAFVPEVIRTPGYPAFVALVYAASGVGNDLAVALAQAVVFVAICLLVFAIARRVAGDRIALGAALLTSLFPTLPYFGALVLTEVWTTLVLTAAVLVCLRAVQEGQARHFLAAGVLFGATTLVRPAFVLLPYFLAIGVPLLVPSQRQRPALVRWATLALAASITLAPWLAYNYVYLGRITLSPAGGVGRGLWEGTWQGRWPGRIHTQLTALAGEPTPLPELEAEVRGLAEAHDLDPGPMLAYVTEWRTIRRIWETPTDPMERAAARVAADQEYRRAALAHIREDPLGHIVRRLTRGTFFLWAADLPVRYTDINRLPVPVVRLIWLPQVVLLLLAVAGLTRLVRQGRWYEDVLLALPLVYVTGVHVPLLCEARQSLPVKPLVLVLAAVGVHYVWASRPRNATP
jgi:4-amino-4-deoxy-L-arabinose transferase-like glycosyltransferase